MVLVGIGSMFCLQAAAACAAVGTYEVNRAHGASSRDALFSAALAGVSAGAFSAVGTMDLGVTSSFVAGGMVGGVMSYMQGGSFGVGFLSAGIGAAVGAYNGEGYSIGGLIRSSIAGGTASYITGGKFGNGAATAAFSYAMTWGVKKYQSGGKPPPKPPEENSASQERGPGKIYVTGHRVGKAGPYHTAIEYDDGTGVQWISAGPEGRTSEGFESLVGGIGSETNGVRATDRPALNITLGEVSPPNGASAGAYFNTLKSAASAYCNCVDYDLFPAISNSYNSNSYVSGLIQATGGSTTVDLSKYVGGGKPLPKSYFGY